jgi:three-Cys-motif partner protein
MNSENLYDGREQTKVKHYILREYLERFALIVGSFAKSITYIDCFSGPWNLRSQQYVDSSFAIAIDQLKRAKATLQEKGKDLALRCMFLEKDPSAFAKLDTYIRQVQGVETRTKNDTLEGSIPDILSFVREGGRGTFPFIFIDPTGWTGFDMALIAPLLKLRPGEVLINFMTDYIRRFIDHPDQETQKTFAALFGTGDFKNQLQGLADHQDREDALLQAYAANVKKTGAYSHSCAATILYPEVDRSYFHLIYATRAPKGVDVFKDVERRAMKVMEQTRAEAKQRARVRKSSQPELFPAEELPHSRPIDRLRNRNLAKAERAVFEAMKAHGRLPYEAAWNLAVAFPLVWESDVKGWIKSWVDAGVLNIEGLKPRQRVPKLKANNALVWIQPKSD